MASNLVWYCTQGGKTYTYSYNGSLTLYDYYDTYKYTFTYTGFNIGSYEDIWMYAEDQVGNSCTSNTLEVKINNGNYVDYSADYEVIEDGDTTNDWKLFYVVTEDDEDRNISAANVTYNSEGTMTGFTTTEENQVYIIASDYILAENMPTTSSGASPYYSSSYPYALYFYNIYSSFTGTANWDSTVSIWNSLYLSTYSNKTNNNVKAAEYLLDTSSWNSYVDSDYASWAIGSPTLELWVDAWNAKGYTELYYNNVGTYGYYVGSSSFPTSTYQYVTSSYLNNSGYDDDIFFPEHYSGFYKSGTYYYTYAYYLASPSAYSSNYLFAVSYNGNITGSTSNYNSVTSSSGRRSSARPVVSLKEGVHGEYDESTGVWTLYNVDTGVTDVTELTLVADITVSYNPTGLTRDSVTVTASLIEEYQEYINSGVWTLQYAIDNVDDDSWQDYPEEGITVTENCTIYFRLTDGTNYTAYATGVVSNITKTYIGYYADVDGDGTVDGIIFADLIESASGQWTDDWGIWSYEAVDEELLKEYEVSTETYIDDYFGTNYILSPVDGTTGEDRFYVMALEDEEGNDNGYAYWYINAYGNLDDSYTISRTTNDFGAGKSNTLRLLDSFANEEYGEAYEGYLELWEMENVGSYVGTSTNSIWFVSSKSEWAAFADTFGIRKTNYSDFGLSKWYWSSSQYSTYNAYYVTFNLGNIINYRVNFYDYVRLSTTF